MRKIREVLRLRYECGCKHRQIALSCSVSPSTVADYLERAEAAGLTWDQARELSEAEVESRLFTLLGRSEPSARVPVDFGWVHRELGRVCDADVDREALLGAGAVLDRRLLAPDLLHHRRELRHYDLERLLVVRGVQAVLEDGDRVRFGLSEFVFKSVRL